MNTPAKINVDGKIHRVINSCWPPIGLFDDLCDDEQELRVLFNLEMLTNARLMPAVSRLAHIPDGDILTGSTAHQAMAAFVHCHDQGGRFNDDRLGAWYGALSVQTAIKETCYHLTRRLAQSADGFPQTMQMRQLVTTTSTQVFDISNKQSQYPELYQPNDYSQSQAWANNIRWPFSNQAIEGVQYSSVRHQGGTNICLFKPDAINRPITQGKHYQYDWNAKGELFISELNILKQPYD